MDKYYIQAVQQLCAEFDIRLTADQKRQLVKHIIAAKEDRRLATKSLQQLWNSQDFTHIAFGRCVAYCTQQYDAHHGQDKDDVNDILNSRNLATAYKFIAEKPKENLEELLSDLTIPDLKKVAQALQLERLPTCKAELITHIVQTANNSHLEKLKKQLVTKAKDKYNLLVIKRKYEILVDDVMHRAYELRHLEEKSKNVKGFIYIPKLCCERTNPMDAELANGYEHAIADGVVLNNTPLFPGDYAYIRKELKRTPTPKQHDKATELYQQARQEALEKKTGYLEWIGMFFLCLWIAISYFMFTNTYGMWRKLLVVLFFTTPFILYWLWRKQRAGK